MIGRLFHGKRRAERRGGRLPARSRLAAHRGVTLVELMVAMLILAIVCVAWLEIIGIQSARKEARRREAVERLAGMMDAFMDYYKDKDANKKSKKDYLSGSYAMQIDASLISAPVSVSASALNPVFQNDSTICYRLSVVNRLPNAELYDNQNLMKGRWVTTTTKNWLIGKLYDLSISDRPYFVLPVCLWF